MCQKIDEKFIFTFNQTTITSFMKRLGLFLIAIIYLNIGYAQLNFTTLYTKEGKETKNLEEAHYFRELALLENSAVQVTERYTADNKTKLIGTYANFKDRYFVGQKFEAYENGKIKSKELYSQDGVLIDTAYYYYPNGKLKIAYAYPHTIKEKKTTVTDTLLLVYHDSLGVRHLFNGDGYAEIDSKNSIEKGNYKNHKRIGKWTGTFMRGKYSFEESYEDGKLIAGITKDSLNNEYKYDHTNFRVEPDYPGGIIAIRKFIATNYSYPKEAIQNRVQGTVKVSFIIDQTGNMIDPKVDEDLGYGTGPAAIRVLKQAKKWKPGIMRGVPVKVAYSLPIRLNVTGN